MSNGLNLTYPFHQTTSSSSRQILTIWLQNLYSRNEVWRSRTPFCYYLHPQHRWRWISPRWDEERYLPLTCRCLFTVGTSLKSDPRYFLILSSYSPLHARLVLNICQPDGIITRNQHPTPGRTIQNSLAQLEDHLERDQSLGTRNRMEQARIPKNSRSVLWRCQLHFGSFREERRKIPTNTKWCRERKPLEKVTKFLILGFEWYTKNVMFISGLIGVSGEAVYIEARALVHCCGVFREGWRSCIYMKYCFVYWSLCEHEYENVNGVFEVWRLVLWIWGCVVIVAWCLRLTLVPIWQLRQYLRSTFSMKVT